MAIGVEPVRLVGRHIILEPISASHADGLFEIGQEKGEWSYLPIPGFSCREDAEHWVRQALALMQQRLHITFVLVHARSGRPIGSTRYLNIRERDCGLEIGYTWVAKPHQRTAANTEAKYLLLKHAFESIGAYRVELKTDLRNARSQRAIERIGARKEGILRRHMVVQGGYVRDSVCYSITDLDWPRVKQCLESMLVR